MSVVLSLPVTLVMLRLRPGGFFDGRVWKNMAIGAAVAVALVLAVIWHACVDAVGHLRQRILAVLAWLGFDRLTRGRSRGATALAFAIVCALVLVEFSQKPYPLTLVEGREVDTWLAKQGDYGTWIQLPVEQLSEGHHIFYWRPNAAPRAGWTRDTLPDRSAPDGGDVRSTRHAAPITCSRRAVPNPSTPLHLGSAAIYIDR